MHDLHAKAAAIELLIFDVDGVLTDGRLFFDDAGREYKSFHVRDGYGIKALQRAGVAVAVISGRSSRAVELRMQNLGIRHVFLGQEDKLPAFQSLQETLNLRPEQIAHVGDDLPDLPILRRVGLAVAVADAHPSILPHCHWRTSLPGGHGAAREVCDLLLDARGVIDPDVPASA